MQLLSRCGLNTIKLLQAATYAPAEFFGLVDRGYIGVNCRADLVLLDGDPTVNIEAVSNVARVWIGAHEVPSTKSDEVRESLAGGRES